MNSFANGCAAGVAAICLFLACGGAKSDGSGSESHFACKADADCLPHGDSLVCVDGECEEREAVPVSGDDASTSSNDGGTPGDDGATSGNDEPDASRGLPELGSAPLLCGSQTLTTQVHAADLLVLIAEQARMDTAAACARLAMTTPPDVPTDNDVVTLCETASARVQGDLAASGASVTIAPGFCSVDAAAQTDCERRCANAEQCTCTPGSVEVRCPPGFLFGTCTQECTGTCAGSAEDPAPCEGSCEALASGLARGPARRKPGTAPAREDAPEPAAANAPGPATLLLPPRSPAPEHAPAIAPRR
jgi:hypothetical protein